MRILLDVMGGDNAPLAPIKGAIKFYNETKSQLVLIGKTEVIEKILKEELGKNYSEFRKNIEIIDAQEEILMEDIPTKAIREKKESSMVKGLKLLKNNEVDVFISAGNSGALLTGATLIVGRIRGVKRAGICATIPTINGKGVCLMDAGANTNCDELNLIQFAELRKRIFKANRYKKPKGWSSKYWYRRKQRKSII